MPIERRNKWYDSVADIEAVQLRTAAGTERIGDRIDALSENLPLPDVLIDRLASIAAMSEGIALATTSGFADIGATQLRTAEATVRIADRIDAISENLPDPAVLIEPLAAIAVMSEGIALATAQGFENIGALIRDAGNAVVGAAENIVYVAAESARTASAVERVTAALEVIASRLPDQEGGEVDHCTRLFINTTDPNGKITRRTSETSLLKAAGFSSLADVIAVGREEFVAKVLQERPGHDSTLVDAMDERELGLFHARAKAVMNSIDSRYETTPRGDEADEPAT